jgi:transcriptional regulator with XRE-family HTH domain
LIAKATYLVRHGGLRFRLLQDLRFSVFSEAQSGLCRQVSRLDSGSILNQIGGMPTQIASDAEFKRPLAEAIRERMKRENLSVSALAKRMGTARTAVRRVLDAKNTSITFRSMSRAAEAVGLKIKLVAEPMSPEELGKLAHRLAGNTSRAESDRLVAKITEGFYGS